MTSKELLRIEIRRQRNNLPASVQKAAGVGVLNQLKKFPAFKASRRIATYLANDGEVPLHATATHLWRQNSDCYLPLLFSFSGKKMRFASYHPASSFLNNKYNIPEPVVPVKKQLKANMLDFVLLPLVAFDLAGNRLGMGGGYYDQTFNFLRFRKAWKKPRLIGVAYDFQQTEFLENDPWDVPVDAIVTPTRLIQFHKREIS